MKHLVKVLVVVDHAVGITGPHRNVVGTLNALSARADVDLRVLSGQIDPAEPYASQSDIHLGFKPHQAGNLIKNLWLLRRTISDRDLVYVPSGFKSFAQAFLTKGKRKLVAGPNVANLPFPWRDDHPGVIELTYMADEWIEASIARKIHVTKSTGIQGIHVIHHAIDTNKFSPHHRDDRVWEKYNIPGDKLKVLYVGHDNTRGKGVEILLQAIEIIRANETISNQVTFVFAGKLSPPNIAHIQSIEDAYTLGFLYPDTLPTIIASADMSIVPSSWENFPFSILEAMSSGLPIIAGRVGGIPEQIIDGETGILLDIARLGVHTPDAPEILARAIQSLAQNAGLRKKLGEAARKRALSYFTEERLGQEFFELFTACLEEEISYRQDHHVS